MKQSSKSQLVLSFSDRVVAEQQSLKNYALKLTKNIDDSFDLVQQTVFKALSNQKRFKTGTNLKGWLFTIMRNSFINDYRRKQTHNTVNDDSDNNYFIDIPSQKIQNSAELKFINDDLEAAISKLSDDLQRVFRLNMIGYKYHEIAEQENIPIGTVKTRIFVARRKLRIMLKEYGEYFGYVKEKA